jgi:hypothetical protein
VTRVRNDPGESRERAQVALRILAIAAALCVVSGAFSPRIRAARPAAFVAQELVYFPSGRFLGEISAGQKELIADYLWLRALQYYGAHRQTDRQYVWARHIFDVITNLNPRFVEAFRFGALVLASDAGEVKAGIDLLKRGFHANANRWQIPFDLGFLYYLAREDLLAAAYFRRAGELAGAPEQVERFAAFAYQRGGRETNARELWLQMRETATNTTTREIADYALRDLDLAAAMAQIDSSSAAFRAAHGSRPRSVTELVRAGFLQRPPEDPFQRGFLIDPQTGRAVSIFKIEETLSQTVATVEQTVVLYRQREGALPDSLGDLLARGYMTAIRMPDGFGLNYDAATGAVTIAAPPHLSRTVRAE